MRPILAVSALLLAASVSSPLFAAAAEAVIGGPCEGCELIFAGMPAELSATARIAPVGAAGEPLTITGTVRTAAGEPASGIVVYAYHTDAAGIYPPGATRHGRLRAWVRTDAGGRYRFATIRPGAYPEGTVPQHVHLHVLEPGCCTYWIASIHFADDPLLGAEARAAMREGRGGSGLVEPRRDATGAWRVERDIVLGQRVPGYPR